jgi:hypothetical protein
MSFSGKATFEITSTVKKMQSGRCLYPNIKSNGVCNCGGFAMSVKLMNEEKLIKTAMDTLIKQLGILESNRFISLSAGKRTDSVRRHRDWQKNLSKNDFFKKVF